MSLVSKTNFIQYLNCPESLWLKIHKPEVYPKGDFSLFLENLVKEGYEVEAYGSFDLCHPFQFDECHFES
jgi:hypothetical protein